MRHDTYKTMIAMLQEYKREGLSEAEAKEKLWKRLQSDPQTYFRLLFDNWFIPNWARYEIVEKDDSSVLVDHLRRSHVETKTKRAEVAKKIVSEAAGIILMKLPMPNGKTLDECTGSDCKKFGGWFAGIAKAIKPTEKIGKKLTEAQLKSLYTRNTK